MEFSEVAKLIAGGGLTAFLLYASWLLWNAFQSQIKERIAFLEARIKTLEGESNDKTENP